MGFAEDLEILASSGDGTALDIQSEPCDYPNFRCVPVVIASEFGEFDLASWHRLEKMRLQRTSPESGPRIPPMAALSAESSR